MRSQARRRQTSLPGGNRLACRYRPSIAPFKYFAGSLRLAAEWGAIEVSPSIKMLPGERHREHVVTFDEEVRYLAAAPEPLASVAAILIDTGMRPDECYRLRWESVTWTNGRNGTILVTHGKTAAARRVLPLSQRARNILQSRWEATGSPAEGWIWPAPTRSGHFEKSTLKKQHKKALRLSRVRPFVLYSLRHTFLTRLGESGCDAWTLARIAGHSSVAMSARYVHPSEDAVLAALDRLSGHNFGHSEIFERETECGPTSAICLKRLRLNWSGREDLNLRPPGPEPGALPG